jgi:hypothetical protein
MTIASDIDSCMPEEFLEVHQFLNTREDTSENVFATRDTDMGRGVGLEIADSFWFFTDYNSGGATFTYFNRNSTTRGPQADLIRTYVHAGYIDTLHSFADMRGADGFTRPMAVTALVEMARAGMKVSVFTDHGSAANTNNIGPKWRGDRPGAAQHHTDLSVFPRGPFRFIGDARYTSEIGYDPLQPITLRDGVRAYAVTRYQRRFLEGWNVEDLHKQLSNANLDKLEGRESTWIVVNHFGLMRDGGNLIPVFSQADREALRELERRYRQGIIYVTTASKLLWYDYVHSHLAYVTERNAQGGCVISIHGVNDPVYGFFVPAFEQLAGITFIVEDPAATRVLLRDVDVTDRLQKNPPDARGRRSIGFPLIHLPPMPEWTSDGITRKTEDYRVGAYDYTFSVANLDTEAFRPTLTYIGLHPFSIRGASIGSTHFIDVPDDKHIRLRPLMPGERLEGLQVLNGPANPAIPRLTGPLSDKVAVESALYDATTGRISLTVSGATTVTLTLKRFRKPFAGARSIIGADGDQTLVARPAGRTTLQSVALNMKPSSGKVEVAIDRWPDGPGDRTWTETLAGAATVAHRVGGLTPGTTYLVLIDGAKHAAIKATAAGEATFDYAGQAGPHRFTLSAAPLPVP